MKKPKTKRKKQAVIRKPAKEKPVLTNFKVLKSDLKQISARAKKYAGGNLSLWLRHAGLHYVPKRKDLAA